MPLTFPARVLCLSVLGLCALTITVPSAAHAADTTTSPAAEEKTELDKYPAYSGPLHVLESNADNGLHDFLAANEGKTVYLDLSIVRYVPIDPTNIDQPDVRAATDRHENAVFTKCWPDPRAEYHGILNFGETGFPLPLDEADIEAGCATRVRFEHQLIESVSAFPVAWGDNKVQVSLKGFFTVSKSAQDGGKTLYTLTDQEDIPLETRLAYDTHKTTKHPIANLSLPQNQ